MFKLLATELKKKGQLNIEVKVTPKSQNNQLIDLVIGTQGQITLKVKIHGVPEKGLVNQELIEFLADNLDLAKSNIQIISGHTSRHKILHLHQ